MKQDNQEAAMPPAQILAELNNYMSRLKGSRPMLNVYPADKKISKSLRENAAIWFSKSPAMITHIDIDNFLRQFFEALADKDVNHEAIMTDVKKHAGMGYNSGGVHGKNEYSKDKSRVDGRMIQRKRR
tara:strand:- start:84 stop:467 length:384 start_codon:yes stop_codon:yes gene_type:complete